MLDKIAHSLRNARLGLRVSRRLGQTLAVHPLLTVPVDPVFLRPLVKMNPILCQVRIADQRRKSLRRAHGPLDHGLRIDR